MHQVQHRQEHQLVKGRQAGAQDQISLLILRRLAHQARHCQAGSDHLVLQRQGDTARAPDSQSDTSSAAGKPGNSTVTTLTATPRRAPATFAA